MFHRHLRWCTDWSHPPQTTAHSICCCKRIWTYHRGCSSAERQATSSFSPVLLPIPTYEARIHACPQGITGADPYLSPLKRKRLTDNTNCLLNVYSGPSCSIRSSDQRSVLRVSLQKSTMCFVHLHGATNTRMCIWHL